jgi:hypothetical protein
MESMTTEDLRAAIFRLVEKLGDKNKYHEKRMAVKNAEISSTS